MIAFGRTSQAFVTYDEPSGGREVHNGAQALCRQQRRGQHIGNLRRIQVRNHANTASARGLRAEKARGIRKHALPRGHVLRHCGAFSRRAPPCADRGVRRCLPHGYRRGFAACLRCLRRVQQPLEGEQKGFCAGALRRHRGFSHRRGGKGRRARGGGADDRAHLRARRFRSRKTEEYVSEGMPFGSPPAQRAGFAAG